MALHEVLIYVFKKLFIRNIIRKSVSIMDRDQDQHFVRPDLGLNCLADVTSRQRTNSVINNVDSDQLLSGYACLQL